MGRLFGTDGVRGLANVELTPHLALALGEAAAHVLGDVGAFRGHRPVAVVGYDGRASGEMLEAAVVAGLLGAGVDVVRAGVVPTPAVAWLTADTAADVGVVISASHNAMPDNGIKFFARGGHKLPDAVEDAVEEALRAALEGSDQHQRPTGRDVGRVRVLDDAVERYAEHLVATAPARLDGLHVVVDCAHGAAAVAAPLAYEKAGARVTTVGADPDGWNINDGVGSTHPELLAQTVREVGADVGIAHDGDADRCLAVDASGELVDGDQILAICALALRDRGALAQDTVVTTVMTNLGFHHAMAAHGVAVQQTAVGDRYVLEALRRDGLTLGGEQSGHVVFLDHATTGDGLLTALQLLGRMSETSRPLAELASVVERLPQVLLNVRVADKDAVASALAVQTAVEEAEAELGDEGRVLLRPSGTEPLVRVMVEAPTEDQARTVAERVAAVVEAAGA